MSKGKHVSRNEIPKSEEISKAVLLALKSGRKKAQKSLIDDTASILQLSKEQKRYVVGNSKTTLFENRVNEVRGKLKTAGLIEYPEKGKVRITPAGKVKLANETEQEQANLIDDRKKHIQVTGPASSHGTGNDNKVQDEYAESVQNDSQVVSQISYEPPSGKPVAVAVESTESSVNNGILASERKFDPPNGSPIINRSSLSDSSSTHVSAADATWFAKVSEKYVSSSVGNNTYLALILAIVGLCFCLTPLWGAGVVITVSSLLVFLMMRKSSKKAPVAQKTTITILAVCALFFFSNSVGAIAHTQSSVSSEPENTPVSIAEEQEEPAVLSFAVSLSDSSTLAGSVMVTVSCNEGEEKGFKEEFSAATGKTYELECGPGTYVFDAKVRNPENSDVKYQDSSIEYVFDGKTDYTVTIIMVVDEEATRIAAEKKEEERLAREAEEQAAREAEELRLQEEQAAAEAAAAAAAAQAAESYNNATVYITDTGAKYHSGGCRHLSQSKYPITRGEAIALGYGPCGTCKPG